ncbi:unnamed protein product [Gordionus sp. m RMFG-2023]
MLHGIDTTGLPRIEDALPWIRASTPIHLSDEVEGIIDQGLQATHNSFDPGIFEAKMETSLDESNTETVVEMEANEEHSE